jgi:hypothetical protein
MSGDVRQTKGMRGVCMHVSMWEVCVPLIDEPETLRC